MDGPPSGIYSSDGFQFQFTASQGLIAIVSPPDLAGSDVGLNPAAMAAWNKIRVQYGQAPIVVVPGFSDPMSGAALGITSGEAALTNAAQQANNQAVAVQAIVTAAINAGQISVNDPAAIAAASAVRKTSQNLALTISKANIDPDAAQQFLNDSVAATQKAAQFATSAGLDVSQAIAAATGTTPQTVLLLGIGFLLYRAFRKNG